METLERSSGMGVVFEPVAVRVVVDVVLDAHGLVHRRQIQAQESDFAGGCLGLRGGADQRQGQAAPTRQRGAKAREFMNGRFNFLSSVWKRVAGRGAAGLGLIIAVMSLRITQPRARGHVKSSRCRAAFRARCTVT